EGGKGLNVDVRILATTNVDLEKAVTEKKLRQDLYYRLNAFTIGMPPLRERTEELPVLLDHCMVRMAQRYGLPARDFSPALLAVCQNYSWPGNLRELENFVKRYLVMGDESLALPLGKTCTLPEVAQAPSPQTLKPASSESSTDMDGLKTLVRSIKGQTEKDAISNTLQKTGWNRKQAAQLLRISYRSLLYKIDQYQLTKPEHWHGARTGNGKRNGPAERTLPMDRQNIRIH
ncbi:MAG: sigma-54-dependent Fis family transcriptional regulator, partial [Acidobacteria bacterium]|nr:sigma-54-dependent Fis family transcriptional regulator [Acidobacteriota bacterium]